MIFNNRAFKRTMAALLSASLVFSAQSLPAQAAKKTKVTKITVTNSSVKKGKVTLKKGKTLKLKVKVSPSKASNKKVSFKSSNKSIATVSSKGKITAKKVGSCKITITAKDGSKKKCTVSLKVVSNSTPKPTPKPTTKPTTTPTTTSTPNNVPKNAVSVQGKYVVLKSASSINNSDFSVSLEGTLDDGTKLNDLVPSTVKKALEGTKITLTNESGSIVLNATYSDYSSDKNLIIYKIDNSSNLQTSKNNGVVGSADGNYKIASDNFIINSPVYASYNEVLEGNSVSGYIYSSGTKTPMKNATVTAYTSDITKTVKTDEYGYYRLPLTSGTYTIEAKAEETSKFFSEENNAKVNTNNKTACNMFIDTYNREELFISGTVRSDVNNEPLANAKVRLYEVSGSTETLLGTITTTANGMYIFKNKAAASTQDFKEYLSINNLKSSDIAEYSKTFAYNKGLNRGIQYKVVVSKEFSKDNLTDAHETKELSNLQIGDSRQLDLGITKLRGIKKIKNFKINTKWTCEMPDVTKETVKTKVTFYKKNSAGRYTSIKSETVSLKVNTNTKTADVFNLIENNFFAKEYPTIPSGKYYLGINDQTNTKTAAINIVPVEVTEGQDLESSFVIKPAKSTAVSTNCTVMNKISLTNFKSGGNVFAVKDTDGSLYTDADKKNVVVTPTYAFYFKSGEDLVYVSSAKADLKYTTNGTLAKIDATTGITRTEEGSEYVILPAQSYIYGNESLSFVQGSQELSETTYSCAGAANINTVKIKSLSQIKADEDTTVTEDTKLVLDYISLYNNESNEKIAEYKPNNKAYTVKSLISSGISIPDTETGFKGLKPTDLTKDTGKYKVALKFRDYDEISLVISVTDFQNVTVTQTSNINYTQKTAVCGNLTIENALASGDIQDGDAKTIDALLVLYDKNGTIVGASTYGNKLKGDKLEKRYSFVNGENAYLEEEGEYTLEIRGMHHNDEYSFETYTQKINITAGKKLENNISLQKGSNGSVTISATDEKLNFLKNGIVTLYDSHYIDLLTMDYVPDYDIYETLTSVDSTLLGIYNVPASKTSEKEWVANQCIPKNTYKAVITSDRTQLYEINNITVSSGQHWVSTDNLIPLLAGENEVKLTLKYAHQLEKNKKSPFEMICVYDESGKVVAKKVIFNTLANEDSANPVYKTTDIYIPNIPGKYSVVIFSTGSFLNKDSITLQGIDKNLEVKLVQSSVVG